MLVPVIDRIKIGSNRLFLAFFCLLHMTVKAHQHPGQSLAF